MIFSVQIDDQTFRIDAENPLSLAIPLRFDGAQPNAYGVEPARSEAYRAGELVGDTRLGGSCNFEQISFIPHCNGTHTESIGHITHARISVNDALRDAFSTAELVSVTPEKASETDETYASETSENDLLITRRALEKAFENPKSKIQNPKSLIVRTLPNDESKLGKTYLDEIPPFFSTEAMHFIREKGVRHLLADLPSIDRLFDGGKLSNHRIFWRVAPESFETNSESLVSHTITELIYVPDHVTDGTYLLNLQIAPFAADASPSRPLLFALLD